MPHHPEKSHLVELLRTKDEDNRMPQKSEPLAAGQIGLIEEWIREGARIDAVKSGRATADDMLVPGSRPLVDRRSGDGTAPAGVFPLATVEAWDGQQFRVVFQRASAVAEARAVGDRAEEAATGEDAAGFGACGSW